MGQPIGIPGTDLQFEMPDLPNPADFAKSALTKLRQFVEKVFGDIGEFFGNAIKSFFDSVKGTFSSIPQWFFSKLKAGWDVVVKGIKNLI